MDALSTLKHFISVNGYTQVQAAQVLGVEQPTIQRWLAGARKVPQTVVLLITALDEIKRLTSSS